MLMTVIGTMAHCHIPKVGRAALSPPQMHIVSNGGLKASRPTWGRPIVGTGVLDGPSHHILLRRRTVREAGPYMIAVIGIPLIRRCAPPSPQGEGFRAGKV